MLHFSGVLGRLSVRVGCILVGCAAMMGCASHPVQPAAARPAPSSPDLPVIVRLVGRNYSVVISAGHKAPVYTVRGSDGRLLAQNVTLEELRLAHEDLYDKLAPAISPGKTVSAAVVTAAIR